MYWRIFHFSSFDSSWHRENAFSKRVIAVGSGFLGAHLDRLNKKNKIKEVMQSVGTFICCCGLSFNRHECLERFFMSQI